jgi:hypothetical protein
MHIGYCSGGSEGKLKITNVFYERPIPDKCIRNEICVFCTPD